MSAWMLAAVLLQGTETPDYKHWASCMPGSWVLLRIDTKSPDLELTQEVTIRLLRVEKDAAYVELVQRVYAGDVLASAQMTQRAIPARVDGDLGVVKETDETLEVAGRKLRCRRQDIRRGEDGSRFEGTFWTCPEIPGGTVKSEGGQVGEKGTSSRMTAVEWRKEAASGVDEVSSRVEAVNLLRKVEETLAKARTLKFDYEHKFDGKASVGRFAREGDRVFFTFTQPRNRGGALTHTRISDGKELVLLVNGKRTPGYKAYAGLGANAVAVLLYSVPVSMDPWMPVEEGAPPRERMELSLIRLRGREKLGEREAVVLERGTGKDRVGHFELLWIDASRFVLLKRVSVYAEAESKYTGRVEDTFSGYVFDELVDPATFVLPKE